MISLEKIREKKRTLSAYVSVFNSEAGKLILQDLMKTCYFFNTTFVGDPVENAFREGERSVLLRLLQTIKLNPEEVFRQLEEQAINETKERSNVPTTDGQSDRYQF